MLFASGYLQSWARRRSLRLVLSRKGLDSKEGGFASPILPDNRLCWLPIPGGQGTTYGELLCADVDVAEIVRSLSRGRFDGESTCHLDPDLNRGAHARSRSWVGAFGQVGAAQSHLAAQGVGPGDLFLFFGWFRRVREGTAGWHYKPDAPDVHVLWGWLQVDRVIALGEGEAAPRTTLYHPHVAYRDCYPERNNALYVARDTLDVSGSEGLPGCGTFARLAPQLQLTAPHARSRSLWRVPSWFAPRGGRTPLTYHGDASRWTVAGAWAQLSTVSRGQEFVLHLEQYPKAQAWLAQVLRSSAA